MKVNLTPEQEQLVMRQLQAGKFRSVEEVIEKALEGLREESATTGDVDKRAQVRAVQQMQEFAEKNRTVLDRISVKLLIHEGHKL